MGIDYSKDGCLKKEATLLEIDELRPLVVITHRTEEEGGGTFLESSKRAE